MSHERAIGRGDARGTDAPWLKPRPDSPRQKENKARDENLLDETTRILTEFARTKFSAQVLDVQGPIQEGAPYRWRMVSNRYEEVTVVGSTKKSLFGTA